MMDHVRLIMGIVVLTCIAVFSESKLVAHWGFNEGTGIALHDSGGNGYDGVITNPAWQPGKTGSSLLFNDTGSSVRIDSINPFKLQKFTCAAWVKPKAVNAGWHVVFSNVKSPSGTSEGIAFGFYDGDVALSIAWTGSGHWFNAYATDSVVDGMWHFVAATCDGVNAVLYADGKEIGRKAFNSTVEYGTAPVSIGRFLTSPQIGNFLGNIDEVNLYDGALSAAEISALYEQGNEYHIFIIPSGTDAKPLFRWTKVTPPYHLFISKNASFSDLVVKISTTDTVYQPAANLPIGAMYWKVGYGAPDTTWLGKSSFVVYPSGAGIVPDQYPTITQAIQSINTIYVRSSIREDMTLTGVHVSIIGVDTGITITGKAGITNSTIVFQKIKLAGIAGATPPDTSVWMPDPCIRSVKPGKDGDTAAIIINSKISLKNSSIKGGSSGKGQKSWLCGGVVPLEELGCELCTVGVDGKEGLALKASQSTTIDTMGVILGAMELDATSRIIAGISPALPFQTHEKEFLPVQPKFHSSGKISLDRKADFTIAIYTITGQLLSKQKINGTCWMAPKLNRGIYLIAINVHNSLFRYKLVNM